MWEPIRNYEKDDFGKFAGQKNAMSSLPLFKAWAAGKGITRFRHANAASDWRRELQTGRSHYTPCAVDPPYLDHSFYFKNPRFTENDESPHTKIWLAYHPYRNAEDIQNEVQNWAVAHGLRAVVYDASKSWYYPGATCLVVVDLPFSPFTERR